MDGDTQQRQRQQQQQEQEQDPFIVSHPSHPLLRSSNNLFPTVMDPDAPTVIDPRDLPQLHRIEDIAVTEVGASHPRLVRGRGPSPEPGPSNPHRRTHLAQPPPPVILWQDDAAIPLNPPVRNVRAYTNEASFDALAHLPRPYHRALRRKIDALRREDVNDCVARDEDLRNVRGGLARHVDPSAGARVLVEIERIDGRELMERVSQWNKSLPTQTSIRDLYHRRPDLFPSDVASSLLPPTPSSETSEDERQTATRVSSASASSSAAALYFDHAFNPETMEREQRGLTPFVDEDEAFDVDVRLPPRVLFPAHPNAVHLPEECEAELKFEEGRMVFACEAPCFSRDAVDVGVKGVGVQPKKTNNNVKPTTEVRIKEEEVELELSAAMEQDRQLTPDAGSGTDTEPEDSSPAAGPSTPHRNRQLPSATPARLLTHPNSHEIGPGLRSLQSLQSSLIDLEQEERRRAERRFEKRRYIGGLTPEASETSSTRKRRRSSSTANTDITPSTPRDRSPSPADSVSSISSDTFTSTLSKVLGAGLLKTAESCLNVAEPEVMLGYTWLAPEEARSVGRKWLEVVPMGSLGSYAGSTASSSASSARSSSSARATSARLPSEAPSVTDPLDESVFSSGPLKGYGCHFFGRQPTSSVRGMQPAWMGKEQAWARVGYDPVNLTGKLCMFVLVQPEWALPERTLSDLSQSQEFTDGARGEKAFTTFEAVWALLVDVCRRYGIRHFAVTSATNIAFGAFSPTYQTGYMSPPVTITSAPMNARGKLNPKEKDSYKPTALQMLMYWMRCSMGSFSEQWNIPEHAGLAGIPGDAAFGYREKFWSTPNVEPASRDAARLVSRRIASTKRVAEAEDGQLFTEVRFAQMSQSVDQEERSKMRGSEMVRALSQGIKRRFEDRDAGDEDIAVYQEVALDFLLPPEEREKHKVVQHRYWRDDRPAESMYLRVSKKRRVGVEDEELEDEAAVEAIVDREETGSMVHMDLGDAEEDMGPYYVPPPIALPQRSLATLQREESLILIQDGPITPAGQRRWVDTLTRKRYLELGHHVIEVDGFMDAQMNAATTTTTTFPVTPTATNTDTTDTENGSSEGLLLAGTTMFSNRSTPVETRKRKIPYRACRGASVQPQHQPQLPTPPPSAASSRRSAAPMSRITKPLPRKKGRDCRAKSVTFQEHDEDGMDVDGDGDVEDEAETEEESVGRFYNTRSRSRSRSVSVRLRSETPVPEAYHHQHPPSSPVALRRSGRKSYPAVPVTASPNTLMSRRKSTGYLGAREKTPTPQSFAQWGLREPVGYDDASDEEDDRERTPGPSTRSKRRRMTSPAVEMAPPRLRTRSGRGVQY